MPQLARRTQQALEILERAQLRQDVLVAAFRGADGPGTADIARARTQRIVGALAVDAADRMDGRQVQHIEAHVGEVGQARLDVAEGAVRPALRAAERGNSSYQLLNCARLRSATSSKVSAGGEAAVRVAASRSRAGRIQRQRPACAAASACRSSVGRRAQLRRPFGSVRGIARRPARAAAASISAAPDFERDADIARVRAPLEFAAPGLEVIDPGDHGVAIAPGHRRRELGRPHIVACAVMSTS